MLKKFTLAVVAVALLLAVVLTGCQPGTTTVTTTATVTATPTTTPTVTATVTDTAAVAALQAELDAANAELESLRLVGATNAETVANVARYYNETHTYSSTDLFVCSDMSSEIWNILETLGINAIMAVGAVDRTVTDILQCSHAWVLAEVEPGQYLAVETTGGYTVTAAENPLYYRGWYYDNPVKLKQYNDWVKEYNTRVEIHNDLVAADQQAVELYNQNNSPSQLAIHEKLVELIQDMRDVMSALIVQVNNLATPLNI